MASSPVTCAWRMLYLRYITQPCIQHYTWGPFYTSESLRKHKNAKTVALNSEKDTCLHCESCNKKKECCLVGPQLETWATPIFTTLRIFVNDCEIVVRIDLGITHKFEGVGKLQIQNPGVMKINCNSYFFYDVRVLEI